MSDASTTMSGAATLETAASHGDHVMRDLLHKALCAERETRSIEFKQSFDPQSAREWCELVKDLVALANSGGGVIVIGLDSSGSPTGLPVDAACATDPADVGNKVSKYTGQANLDFEMFRLEKSGHQLAAFVIPAVAIPLVFVKPGTYDVGGGKQNTAFGVGTVYFRHGAKSEPGTSDDIRRVVERQVQFLRKSWIQGVKKVVQAPPGAQVVTLVPTDKRGSLTSNVRIVQDESAIPVRLTRDSAVASGAFIHEELSDGIFDEIDNVIDANRVLSRGQREFLLGQPVYYRIYAERQHVRQAEDCISNLLKNGIEDFYAPNLFWALALPDRFIVKELSDVYLYPSNRHVHSLMRISILLGQEFSEWLLSRWDAKWKQHAQPPAFYFTFKKVCADLRKVEPLFLASRLSPATRIAVNGETPALARDLVDKPELAAALLSKACLAVFRGAGDHRSMARNLDFLVYGSQIQRRAPAISEGVMKMLGTRRPGDVVEAIGPEGES